MVSSTEANIRPWLYTCESKRQEGKLSDTVEWISTCQQTAPG